MQTSVEGFRLSPQQRRLWRFVTDRALAAGRSPVADRAATDRTFASQLVLLLEGEVRIDVIREAVERVCGRHEALRTRFRRLPGVAMPVQTVSDDFAIAWQAVEITDDATVHGSTVA